jgi:hypothetical protein
MKKPTPQPNDDSSERKQVPSKKRASPWDDVEDALLMEYVTPALNLVDLNRWNGRVSRCPGNLKPLRKQWWEKRS